MSLLELRVISSLENVLPVAELDAASRQSGTALKGEKYHFQIAYRWDNSKGNGAAARVRVESPLADRIRLFAVGQVPVLYPDFFESDDNFITKTPALLPDPLLPFNGVITYKKEHWSTLWCEVDVGDAAAATYPIRFVATDEDNAETVFAQAEFQLEVVNARLPDQTLLYTDWLHGDCLATEYEVPVFSQRYWEILENYLQNAADYGMNMVLTPLFTPPLDTKIGGERLTVQLIDAYQTEQGYRFDFSKVERFMALAEKCGIRYFEMCHLFTQWGAHHAPKIVVHTADGEKRIFGWDTDAQDPAFVAFLQQCLAELKAFLKARGCWERCWFHISDEPNAEALDSYRAARDSVLSVLEDANRMDALSEYDYYTKGLVPTPVVATDHIEPFLENNVPNLWAYYCCCQVKDVSNRLIAMPSARNRICGWQLFRYDIKGFLHWGHNFWYSVLSRQVVQPWQSTDANGGFPSGDAFCVYPGKDGKPVNSLRVHVFCDALQDMRALQLLEQKQGRDAALQWLAAQTEAPLTFRDYPRDSAWILNTRDALNRAVAE